MRNRRANDFTREIRTTYRDPKSAPQASWRRHRANLVKQVGVLVVLGAVISRPLQFSGV